MWEIITGFSFNGAILFPFSLSVYSAGLWQKGINFKVISEEGACSPHLFVPISLYMGKLISIFRELYWYWFSHKMFIEVGSCSAWSAFPSLQQVRCSSCVYGKSVAVWMRYVSVSLTAMLSTSPSYYFSINLLNTWQLLLLF